MKQIEIPKSLLTYTKKPAPFAPGDSTIWTDAHVAKSLLASHLNPIEGGASRIHTDIDRSATWITEISSLEPKARILDLGCGPGLYAERWARRGFEVTGIDFSENSIAHAKISASSKSLAIDYRCGSYLETAFPDHQDLITLIYCDFGILSFEKRARLLRSIRQALAPCGRFVFDVFTPHQAHNISLDPICFRGHDGFWSSEEHIVLNQNWIFEDLNLECSQNVLEQQNGNRKVFRRWGQMFTHEMISEELANAKLKAEYSYSNLFGAPLTPESPTLGIVASAL